MDGKEEFIDNASACKNVFMAPILGPLKFVFVLPVLNQISNYQVKKFETGNACLMKSQLNIIKCFIKIKYQDRSYYF